MTDEDYSLINSLYRVFSRDFRLYDAHHFVCKIDKTKSKKEAYAEHKETKKILKDWGTAKSVRSLSLYGMAKEYLTEMLKSHHFCEEVIFPDKRAMIWLNNPIQHPLPPIDKGSMTIDCRTDVSMYENDQLATILLSVNDHSTNAFIQHIRRHISIMERPLVTARGDGKSYIYANFNPKYAQYAITILRTQELIPLPSYPYPPILFHKTPETAPYYDPVQHDVHTNESVIMQKIYQHVAGYHADDHADTLRYDPTLATILNKEKLASQPTMSRVNQLFDKTATKQLQRANEILLERFHSASSPENIILDLDSTNAATYGNQYGSTYNSHYGENGYHPMLMFDGMTGDCLKAELRAGSVYTSRQVVRFVGPTLKRYKRLYPWITPVIRGDSGFAVPELFELAETKESHYVIRLKSNKRLTTNAEEMLAQIPDDVLEATPVFYREFTYKAKSWTQPRRVVVKMEKPADELLFRCVEHEFVA